MRIGVAAGTFSAARDTIFAVPNLPLLTPTDDQLTWQQRRVGLFFHVGINTYFAQEWSDGTLPASGFDPTGLDVDGWMEVAVAAGARYVILTAKHHDGFCLWPTETTAYGVASSPWRDGRGDLVGEFVAAARRYGLAVGLYLSPWDRNATATRTRRRTHGSTGPS